MQQTITTTATAADDRAADEASQFSKLPPALLTRILQLLPQRERLIRCSNVCKAWAAAATAATAEVEHGPTQYAFPDFQPWLRRHATQLVSLQLRPFHTGYYPAFMSSLNLMCRLPCREMQHVSRLDLGGLELELHMPADSNSNSSSSSSSSRATAPIFPRLKELKLFDCKLSRSTLMQLAQVSTITHLELLPAELHAQRAGPRVDPDAVKQMLQGMPNLAHLKLACAGDDANLIPALPALSLTALTLGLDWESERPNFPDSASQLVHLRTLALHRAVYSPSALAGLTLLTQLSLRSCQPAPPGLDAATAFLEAVRGMRHLQHLAVVEAYDAEALYGVSDEDVAFLRAADPRACAALTAASQLTCLEICCEYGQPLPAAALQHMFPAGTQLSRLQHLMVSASDYEHAGGIRSADLRSAVGACPALHHLSLHGVLAADVDVDVLLELPSTWRSLAVGGAAFGDRAVPVIAQLTQLTSLQWGGSPGLMAAGLVPLTQLRALQTCCVPVADLDGIRHGFSGVRHLTAGEKERCQPGFCPVFW